MCPATWGETPSTSSSSTGCRGTWAPIVWELVHEGVTPPWTTGFGDPLRGYCRAPHNKAGPHFARRPEGRSRLLSHPQYTFTLNGILASAPGPSTHAELLLPGGRPPPPASSTLSTSTQARFDQVTRLLHSLIAPAARAGVQRGQVGQISLLVSPQTVLLSATGAEQHWDQNPRGGGPQGLWAP